MKSGLSKKTLEKINTVFQQHPEIKTVRLFGSRAIGNYRKNSDIDLALTGKLNDQLLNRIYHELDELPLPYLFDVKIYSQISHAGLKKHIKFFGKEIYSKKQSKERRRLAKSLNPIKKRN
ncbi:MAG: hypothetical protein A3I12_04600 [Gammaproteobacteria bacterium RIFCSPLOWO2_02_FULL_38_11]|nr:MAG: hypothetical protein A3B69_04430 [Gammaproteobacteria bacterium RIFCSPHIGHO2_02_FULL_38_33]OGT23609.1 MAG: hypothetical protein A2W47_03230 [Gammaproteobacteria bacterium RIFCSPHIGHO2_12_38_15]OGT68131.1 MAG: hypothetical protein A3I12_04600 [Gammaproteobacteria bacterium RIFCSPLOWO2_02_FULL_38_11]OGT77824.1 MAG: hypothetical protein A3G71_03505 [Gammaproteobacteria bacterium RIFCSPLOWO2_12_FULL_38_14]